MRRRGDERGSSELGAVERQFARWRAHRQRGHGRIPEELWKAAALLVGPMPITTVTERLRLEARKLRMKVNEYGAGRRPMLARTKANDRPRFMEISASGRGATGPGRVEGVATGSAHLELERADGTRLRLYPGAVSGPEVAQLIERFMVAGRR